MKRLARFLLCWCNDSPNEKEEKTSKMVSLHKAKADSLQELDTAKIVLKPSEKSKMFSPTNASADTAALEGLETQETSPDKEKKMNCKSAKKKSQKGKNFEEFYHDENEKEEKHIKGKKDDLHYGEKLLNTTNLTEGDIKGVFT